MLKEFNQSFTAFQSLYPLSTKKHVGTFNQSKAGEKKGHDTFLILLVKIILALTFKNAKINKDFVMH